MKRRGLQYAARLCPALVTCLLALPVLARPGVDETAGASGLGAASVISLPARAELAEPRPPAGPGGRLEFIPLTHLLFEHDRIELTPRTQQALDDAARFVMRTPGIRRVLISGHADYTDGMNYNYHLSDQRAEAVRYYLIARGVDTDLLHITGFGELQPTDENWTRYGRHRNRRVELYVVRYAD